MTSGSKTRRRFLSAYLPVIRPKLVKDLLKAVVVAVAGTIAAAVFGWLIGLLSVSQSSQPLQRLIAEEARLAKEHHPSQRALYGDLFTEDAVISDPVHRRSFEGRASIVERFTGLQRMNTLSHRLVGPPTFESWRRARARTQTILAFTNEQGEDEAYSTGEEWLFVRRYIWSDWRVSELTLSQREEQAR